jgi:hypothetical protein
MPSKTTVDRAKQVRAVPPGEERRRTPPAEELREPPRREALAVGSLAIAVGGVPREARQAIHTRAGRALLPVPDEGSVC